MNKKQLIFIFIVLLAGGYYFFFSDRNIEENLETTEQEELSPDGLLSKELANKYQAAVDWDKGLDYTLEIQERLIGSKPALFRGYVDDVFRRDGKIFVRFSSSFFSSFGYVLELECDQQIVDKIFVQKTNDKTSLRFLDEYAVVANIQEVTKPIFALEGSSLYENEVEISVQPSVLFTAKGMCVDIVYLGDTI